MKKIFLLLAALLGVSCTLFAQNALKEGVAIVRPTYHASSVQFLRDMSEELRKDGFTTSADRLKSSAERGGGQGSGFVYKAENGSCYLITNRHVVAEAESVTVEFESVSGGVVTYKSCPLVAVGHEVDLALVAFPSDAQFSYAIALSSKQIGDGDEVFSAGFPDLAGSASWQLGKGIVSNAALKLDARIDPLRTVVIQHTAQVDPGSSGGPLLVRVGSGYEAVGLNTWKVVNRENVNIAIPSAVIKEFVNNSLKIKDLDKKEMLLSEVKKLTEAAADYRKMAPLISFAYLAKVNAPAFRSLYSASSVEANREISYLLERGRPIEAQRVALADALVRQLGGGKKSLDFSSIEGIVSADAPATVSYTHDKKPLGTTWVFEQGAWRLGSVDNVSIEGERVPTNGVGVDYDMGLLLRLGAGFPVGGNGEKTAYSVGVSAPTTYALLDFELRFGNEFVTEESDWIYEQGKQPYRDTTTFWNSYTGVTIGFGLQLPVKVKSVFLVPYAKGVLGFDFRGEERVGIVAGYAVGAHAAYRLTDSLYPLLGVELGSRKVHLNWDGQKFKLPTLSVYVGVAF